jgi:Flp pilus assembly protein TadG
MLIAPPRPRRRGALTVEFAITSGVTFFLILAMIIGGLGVFRYQEVAHLAREGARYASTHGGQYALDGMPTKTGVPAVSSSSDLRNYLMPRSTLLNPDKTQVAVSWSAAGNVTPSNMPTYLDTNPDLVPPGQKSIRNFVTVTVTYQWVPEMFLVGPLNLTSTSTMAMTY